MTVLAVETSAKPASAAIVTHERTIAEVVLNNKKTHSETLLPMIDYIFNSSGMELSSVTHVAVTTGPGSFTGIRIGVSTAKAIACGAGLPLIGVPTLDALAYNISHEGAIIVPVMDARRSQVYTCFYEIVNGTPVKLEDYAAMSIDQCLEKAREYKKPALFLGDGICAYGESILSYDKEFSLAPVNNNMQRASSVGLWALNNPKSAVHYNELPVYYLRKPQAEREYENGRKQCTV